MAEPDKEALAERLVELYSDKLLRLAYSILNSVPDAQDVCQEVLLKALDRTQPFESRAHEKAWLLRVTVNCARKLHAAPWRRLTEPLSDLLAAPEPEESGLWDALQRLRPEDRTVLHLYYYEELSTGEIARLLGCRPGTVRSRLTRARERLREQYKEDSP